MDLLVLRHLLHLDGKLLLSYTLGILRPVGKRVRSSSSTRQRRSELCDPDVRFGQFGLGARGIEVWTTAYLAPRLDHLVDLVCSHLK